MFAQEKSGLSKLISEIVEKDKELSESAIKKLSEYFDKNEDDDLRRYGIMSYNDWMKEYGEQFIDELIEASHDKCLDYKIVEEVDDIYSDYVDSCKKEYCNFINNYDERQINCMKNIEEGIDNDEGCDIDCENIYEDDCGCDIVF